MSDDLFAGRRPVRCTSSRNTGLPDLPGAQDQGAAGAAEQPAVEESFVHVGEMVRAHDVATPTASPLWCILVPWPGKPFARA